MPFGQTLSNLFVRIRADHQDALRGIEEVQNKVDKMAGGLDRAGKKMLVGFTLPLAAAGTAALKLASQAQEASDKVEDVFGDQRGAVDELANSYRVLSRGAAQDLLGTTGNILTAMGFTREEAAGVSVQVGELARDMASFNDERPQDTFLAINAALTGEAESLKRLGVVLQDAEVKQRALLDTGKELQSELTQQELVQARLNLIFEKASNQVGNFERTQDSLANRMRDLNTRVQNVTISLGEQLIPAAEKIVGVISGWVERLEDLEPAQQKLIVGLGLVGAAAGPVLIVTAKLINAGKTIAGVYKTWTAAVAANTAATNANAAAQGRLFAASAALLGKLRLIAAPLAAIGGLLFELKRQLDGSATRVEKLLFKFTPIGGLAESVRGFAEEWEKLRTRFELTGTAADTLTSVLDKLVGKTREAAGETVKLASSFGSSLMVIRGTPDDMDPARASTRALAESQQALADASARAEEATKKLTRAMPEQERAFERLRDRMDETRQIAADYITELEIQSDELMGVTAEMRRYREALEAADPEQRNIIELQTEANRVAREGREALAELAEKAGEASKRQQEAAAAAEKKLIDTARVLAADFFGPLKNAWDGLRLVTGDALDGIAGKLGDLGSSLVGMAGPGGPIFAAVQSIGRLFGFDLFGAVKSALAKIGKAVGNFFKGLFGGGDDLSGTLGLEGGLEEEDIVRVRRTIERNQGEPFAQLSELLERAGLSEESRILFLAEKLAEGTALGLEGEASKEFFRDIIRQILEGQRFADDDLNRLLGEVFEEFFTPPEVPLDERIDQFIDEQMRRRFDEPPSPGTPVSPSLTADFRAPTDFAPPSIRARSDIEVTVISKIDGREAARAIVPFVVDEIWTDTGLLNK